MTDNTQLLDCDRSGLRDAAKLIEQGKVVLLSNGTMFGFCTNALSKDGVEKINEMKRRNQPMTVSVRKEDVDKYAYIPVEARDLIAVYWPGYLSIICNKKSIIPNFVTSDLSTVCLTSLAYDVGEIHSKYSLVPMACTSGNRHGEKPIFTWQEGYRVFQDEVDAVIKSPDCDTSEDNIPDTTQLSFIKTIPEVWRLGHIPVEELKKSIPNLRMKA